MTRLRPDRMFGAGHDEFWSWCDKGELRLPRCSGCSHLQWPIAPTCEQCGESDFAFERMTGRGEIASWCTFVHDYYKGAFDIPYDTIVVALEEGPLFISNPSGFAGDEIKLGQRVTVEFAAASDSAGAYNLPVFRKV